MYRQTQYHHSAQMVAALYALRNSERQAALFQKRVVPAAQQIVDNSREAYTRGTGSFLEMIDAQRTLLEVRLTAAEARAAREKSLADLEALLGLDVETLAPPATRPATTAAAQPATAPAPTGAGEDVNAR
jgi:cobalt-zinc-cadmium efflux system outer membrane protein